MKAEYVKRLIELERRIAAIERKLRLTDAKIVQARDSRKVSPGRAPLVHLGRTFGAPSSYTFRGFALPDTTPFLRRRPAAAAYFSRPCITSAHHGGTMSVSNLEFRWARFAWVGRSA